MTSQSAPERRAVGVHLLLQLFSAITFFVGVWLVTTAVLVGTSLGGVLSPSMPMGFVRNGDIFVVLSIVAGVWFAAAAVLMWMKCSPSRVRQLLATLVFLPAVWGVVAFVQWIPETHFGWRILAVPLAFLVRAACYEVADGRRQATLRFA